MLWPRVTQKERKLLEKIAAGGTLKSHRDINGIKKYVLYNRGHVEEAVSYNLVQALLRKNLLTTNQKVPAATFLLTTKGQKALGLDTDDLKGIGGVVKFDSENRKKG
ncbi:MAG: hypothetical protein AAF633_12895 [Chloroflexota bacterium]